MRNWLKRLVAGKEMAELDRWRMTWGLHRKWLAEFSNVSAVLDSMKAQADGGANEDASELRAAFAGTAWYSDNSGWGAAVKGFRAAVKAMNNLSPNKKGGA